MANSMPLVTALVRTYQSADTLPFAIASVLAQTVEDLECLIVDDASTDDTSQVVARFNDPRIRYVRHHENLGRAGARRTGLTEARGQFLGLLDGDDWWYPWKLERQLSALRAESELSLVSCGMAPVNDAGNPMGAEQVPPGPPRLIRFSPFRAPRPVPFPNAPSLFRTEAIRDARIDLSLARCEDFDFILPVLLQRSSALWTEPLYAYTLPASVRYRAHAASAAAARRVYAKYLPRYPFASLRRQVECLLKQAAYAASGLVHGSPVPSRRGGREPVVDELEDFQRARTVISEVLNAHLG